MVLETRSRVCFAFWRSFIARVDELLNDNNSKPIAGEVPAKTSKSQPVVGLSTVFNAYQGQRSITRWCIGTRSRIP